MGSGDTELSVPCHLLLLGRFPTDKTYPHGESNPGLGTENPVPCMACVGGWWWAVLAVPPHNILCRSVSVGALRKFPKFLGNFLQAGRGRGS